MAWSLNRSNFDGDQFLEVRKRFGKTPEGHVDFSKYLFWEVSEASSFHSEAVRFGTDTGGICFAPALI